MMNAKPPMRVRETIVVEEPKTEEVKELMDALQETMKKLQAK